MTGSAGSGANYPRVTTVSRLWGRSGFRPFETERANARRWPIGRTSRLRAVSLRPEAYAKSASDSAMVRTRAPSLRISSTTARSVLEQYRNRYSALKDAVTETEPTFRDDLLAEIALVDLLTAPVYVLAEMWRNGS